MLIDGREIAKKLKLEIADEVIQLKAKGIYPCLCVCLVGDDPASKIYVKNKQKSCEEVGIISKAEFAPSSSSTSSMLDLIRHWNSLSSCHGILVQLPLPEHMDRLKIINAVSPNKDVDGFHYQNIGLLTQGCPGFVPCTPLAVKYLLDYHKIEYVGKSVVIINDTIIVGRPLAMLLLNNDVTVTLCNSKTERIREICSSADILVSAVGKRPNFVLTKEFCKKGVIIVDVGINKCDNVVGRKIIGDVDIESVKDVAKGITPVPGGVGPITVAMLMKNIVRAAKNISGL